MARYTIKDFLNIKSAGGPSLNPAATKLIYQSNESGTFQIYLQDLTQPSRPVQLTDFADQISFALFSPISDDIIFGRDEGGNEQEQFYLINSGSKQVEALTAEPEVRHNWGSWSRDGQMITFSSNKRNGTDFDIYVMDLKTRRSRMVMQMGGWCSSLVFSPSGRYLVASQRHSNTDNDLYLIDLVNGQTRHLTPHQGDATYYWPRWLPDETGFYLISDQGTDLTSLRSLDLKSLRLTDVLAPPYEVEAISLTWDGRTMAVRINQDGYGLVKIYDTATFKPLPGQALPKGTIAGLVWSQDGNDFAFSLSNSTQNQNVWVWNRRQNHARQISEIPMVIPRSIMVEESIESYQSFDGLRVPYFAYWPRAKLAPVVIWIHGGPEGQYRPGWSSVIQYLVYNGYAVVAPNVRGSSGYGKTYLGLDDVDKRLDSVADLKGLYDHLCGLKQVDKTKIALMGGSYGGYMVLAGLAFQPELWAAGVCFVGISNLVTFLTNTADYRRALRESEYGSLKRDRALLEAVSPYNRIDRIKAPLMLIHGANDPRVPLTEAEQIASNLQRLNRKVDLLVYHDEGHGLSKLKNRLDAYPKVIKFLDSILK